MVQLPHSKSNELCLSVFKDVHEHFSSALRVLLFRPLENLQFTSQVTLMQRHETLMKASIHFVQTGWSGIGKAEGPWGAE